MNEISPELLAQFYAQDSEDPFLALITLNHSTLVTPLRFVNNSESIVSRLNTYIAFPFQITMPPDDGETLREVAIVFDNVSREIIDELRSITTPMDVKVEMVLASNRDYVQLTLDELKSKSITYNKQVVSMKLFLDTFLNISMTSEKYSPTSYPGLF